MKRNVGILLTDPGSTGIWLCERIRTADPFHGYWATPGGRVEPNEGLAAAILRELAEETGIIWDGEFSLNQLTTGTYHSPDGEQYEATHFIMKTDLIPQNTEPEKHGPWEFFTWIEACNKLLMRSTLEAVYRASKSGLAKIT